MHWKNAELETKHNEHWEGSYRATRPPGKHVVSVALPQREYSIFPPIGGIHFVEQNIFCVVFHFSVLCLLQTCIFAHVLIVFGVFHICFLTLS